MGIRLEGKRAVITAAGQGIGRAIATAFYREGAKVFATDLKSELLQDLPPAIDRFSLDVLDHGQIIEARERTGPADILVNCTGFVHHGSILEFDDRVWDMSFDLNVKAHVHMIQAYLPAMLEQKNGSIIEMASVVSSIKGVVNRCAYGASKAALIGLTKAVAADYVSKGIRCNAICPGTVETPSLYERMHAQGDADKARVAFIARQPMGRLGQTQEIASLAVYLASDEAAFMTGQAIAIDGGFAL